MIPIIMVLMYPLVMLAVALIRLGIYIAIVVLAFAIRMAFSLAVDVRLAIRRWRHRRRWRTFNQEDSWRSRPETPRFKLMWRYSSIVWKLRELRHRWHEKRRV